jgi:hypothetical protein
MGIVRMGYDYEDNGTAADFLALFPPIPGRIAVLDAEYKGLSMPEAEKWATTVSAAYGIERTWLYGHALLGSWRPAAGSILRTMRSWQATYGMKLTPVPWARDPDIWQYSDGQAQWVTVNGKREFHWYSPGPRYFAGVGSCDMNMLRIPVATLRSIAGLDQQGGDVTQEEFNAMFKAATGYAPNDAAYWLRVATGIGDVIRGQAKRNLPVPYPAAFDWATKVQTGGAQLPEELVKFADTFAVKP